MMADRFRNAGPIVISKMLIDNISLWIFIICKTGPSIINTQSNITYMFYIYVS